MRDTAIIQFTIAGGISDLDWLIEIEEALIQGFSQNGKAVLDGHDFGTATMNIFVIPKRGWGSAIEIVKAYLANHKALHKALIIKRSKTGRYSVVWPENYGGEFERV